MQLLKSLLTKLLKTNTKKSKTNLQKLLIDDIKKMIFQAYLESHLDFIKSIVEIMDDIDSIKKTAINAHIEFHSYIIKAANYQYYKNKYQHPEILTFIANSDDAIDLDKIRIHLLSNSANYAKIELILYERMIAIKVQDFKILQSKIYQND